MNYPTLSELYKIAAHNGLNRAAGASAHALADLPGTESTVAMEDRDAVTAPEPAASTAGCNGKKVH